MTKDVVRQFEEVRLMRLRSTGLGKTELKGDIASLEPRAGLLILHIQTTSPVKWHIRAGMQRKDVFKLIRSIFCFSVMKYMVGIIASTPVEPNDF